MTKDELTLKPIGSGPWKYDEITDASVTLSPNENYNGDHPAKDNQIRVDVLKDATARVTAQQEGTTLVCESVPPTPSTSSRAPASPSTPSRASGPAS